VVDKKILYHLIMGGIRDNNTELPISIPLGFNIINGHGLLFAFFGIDMCNIYTLHQFFEFSCLKSCRKIDWQN